MARPRTVHVCQECGAEQPRWSGRCPECGAWNAMVEERRGSGGAPPAAEGAPAVATGSLAEVDPGDAARVPTGLPDLDRVLGGGLVRGSAVLLGGDPGIGKSTLMLQAAGCLAGGGGPVLYASGEESGAQVRMRAERLGIDPARIRFAATDDLGSLCDLIGSSDAAMAVVDSIQTVRDPRLESAPGSVAQVRESAAALVRCAKETGTSLWLVGHVTKSGAIAGPRTLEHLVDVVLTFEGERASPYRILRGTKNRFGTTEELAVFEMGGTGLAPVENPSELFLSESRGVPGTVLLPVIEGNRAYGVEIQALTAPAHFGTPERRVTGTDYARTCMLLAVLEQRCGLSLKGMDVYVNAVGGIRATEPAADLAVALAVASAHLGRIVPDGTAAAGEVGLTGEVRPVGRIELRLREAERLGTSELWTAPLRGKKPPDRRIRPVRTLAEAIDRLASAGAASRPTHTSRSAKGR